MLKTTRSLDVSGPEIGNDDSEVVKFGVGGSEELAKKSRKSKGQILFKSRKSAKSRKNLSKSGNSPNFGTTKTGPSFLTPDAREAFNRLRLMFTKALIFWYFNPEYHIWIKTDVLGNAIGGVLSQLTSGTRPDRVVTKTDLD